MKKVFFLLSILFCAVISFAQHVPQGMKYQAVARNLSGNVLSGQSITLKINLLTQDAKGSVIYYSESHAVTTNQVGLFTLTIGEGKIEKGKFTDIPWSTADIWMQVAIKDKGQQDFMTISNSKLLAVPYAFHSETANRLSGENTSVSGSSPTTTTSSITTSSTTNNTSPSANWSLKGNTGSNPLTDKLGTGDFVDLILVTNNTERIRILANGNVVVANDLNVSKNVNLNTVSGSTDIKGATNLQNTLDVTGAAHLKNTLVTDGLTSIKNTTQSTTPANGALVVDGGVGIAKNLNVGGTVSFGGASTFGGQLHITDLTQSTSTSTGALIVDGGTGIGKNLNVGGATDLTGAANLQNTLDVTGATHLKNTLVTDGATSINNSLTITKSDENFVATIINNNEGEGDGLKIKLGRAKSSYTVPSVTAPSVDEISAGEDFKNLLRCDYSGNRLTLLGNIIVADATETAKVIAGIAISAGNYIVSAINSGLHLPLSIPDVTVPAIHLSNSIDIAGPINTNLGLPIKMPTTTVFPGFSLGLPDPLPNISIGSYSIGGFTIVPSLPALSIPAIDVPQTTLLTGREVMPSLPQISVPGIPAIDITNLAFWGLDFNLCLSDVVGSSPLNNNNEFIHFADKNDAQVGSIRGVSVTNWAANYLNPVFLSKLRGAFLSSKMDKFHAQYHFKNEVATALASYAKIGVEYSSGNGDYAEWLERSDLNEFISAGDIVSVKGGKISKDLKNAEQVMVASHAPIMLGNMPAEGKTDLGNSIVFIGQAPVKIMGSVVSGDYIIGQINTPGYGIAKHPKDMTIEDFKLAVGRSWDTDETDGIKMANTVIGVHNSSFLNLIKELKDKADNNEARLKAIEAKLNIGTSIKSNSLSAKNKK